MKATAFIAGLGDTPLGPARCAAILAALDRHVPWPMAEIPILDKDGHERGSFQATIDVFAIGELDDFVRVPVDGPTGQRIADQFGLALPTPRMVDLIYQASTIRLAPITRPPAPSMTSVAWFVEHSRAIDTRLAECRADHPDLPADALIAGIKKDVTRSNQRKPGRLGLYGWHTPVPIQLDRLVRPGEPIQPFTNFHEQEYADESHGLRLCSASVVIDGETYGMDEALASPTLSVLLSEAGPLTSAALRYP